MKIVIERFFKENTPLNTFLECNIIQNDKVLTLEGYCKEKKFACMIIKGLQGDITLPYRMITKITFNR